MNLVYTGFLLFQIHLRHKLICAKITHELISLGLLFHTLYVVEKWAFPHFSLSKEGSVTGSTWHHEK